MEKNLSYDIESIELCLQLLTFEIDLCKTDEEKDFLKNGINLIRLFKSNLNSR